MTVLCPSCGTEAPEDLPECVNCGQVLLKEVVPGEVQPGEVLPDDELLREIVPGDELLREVVSQEVPLREVTPVEVPFDDVAAEELPLPEVVPEIERLEGLEETRFGPADAVVQPLPGLEGTALPEEGFPLPDEPLDIERTEIQSPAGAAQSWDTTLPGFERGREDGHGQRTAAPGNANVCSWCGAEGQGLFCDSCGRRKTNVKPRGQVGVKGRRPVADDEDGPKIVEAVMCPACFARRPPYHDDVRGIDRCGECGVPLPQQDVP
jgi:hypothetical protein